MSAAFHTYRRHLLGVDDPVATPGHHCSLSSLCLCTVAEQLVSVYDDGAGAENIPLVVAEHLVRLDAVHLEGAGQLHVARDPSTDRITEVLLVSKTQQWRLRRQQTPDEADWVLEPPPRGKE